MTHNANALRAFVPKMAFPVLVFPETSEDPRQAEEVTRARLLQYIRAGLVTGRGTRNRINHISFVAGTRELMKRLRMVKPDHAKHIPIAGDVVLAYQDTRRKYRRSGLPRVSKCITVLSGGRTCEETITRVA